ncbi:MAG TPA: 3-dehydroquinate synthase, partial [Candidatus Bathyarchaeia archaeon]|nr:3-dehydroquinate synthase [Candidatus Bathyarchaeia archaeon]
ASGEASKSAETAFEVIRQMAEKQAARDIFVVALGGGVVGDLAGFVAAVYKRGVPYVQVPTTLLAQIDSAIGGKVAIDLPFGKNLVGAFYHPRVVFTDVGVLSSLDRRQIQAGLAEAVKYGVICDKNLFELIENNVEALLGLDQKCLTEVVDQCSRIKASIVARDEREEKGMRTILNFGHTVGHAIETAAQYADYNHGEAIVLGMRIAAEMSLQLKLAGQEDVDRLNVLLSRIGLPKTVQHVEMSAILDSMKHDKKFKGGKNRFVLMTGIGRVKVVEDVDVAVIRDALKKHMSGYDNPPVPADQLF